MRQSISKSHEKLNSVLEVLTTNRHRLNSLQFKALIAIQITALNKIRPKHRHHQPQTEFKRTSTRTSTCYLQ